MIVMCAFEFVASDQHGFRKEFWVRKFISEHAEVFWTTKPRTRNFLLYFVPISRRTPSSSTVDNRSSSRRLDKNSILPKTKHRMNKFYSTFSMCLLESPWNRSFTDSTTITWTPRIHSTRTHTYQVTVQRSYDSRSRGERCNIISSNSWNMSQSVPRCYTTFRFAGIDREPSIRDTRWKHNHRSSPTREIPLRYIPRMLYIFVRYVSLGDTALMYRTFSPLFEICIAEALSKSVREEIFVGRFAPRKWHSFRFCLTL